MFLFLAGPHPWYCYFKGVNKALRLATASPHVFLWLVTRQGPAGTRGTPLRRPARPGVRGVREVISGNPERVIKVLVLALSAGRDARDCCDLW